MCIQGYVGEVVLAKTDWFSPLCDVVIGEAVGLHTILQCVLDIQFDNVDSVLDSQQVVDSFHTCIDDNSEFGCIINCFKIVSKTLMSSLMRRANGVTHDLAKIASSDTSPHIYDDVLSYIWHILTNEMHWSVY